MSDCEVRACDNMDPERGLPSLPDKSVDVVITDPPYSERVHRRLGREDRDDGVAARAEIGFRSLTDAEAGAVAGHLARLAMRWVLVFCDELSFAVWVRALEAAGCEYVRKGTYVKIDAMPQMSGDRPAAGTEEIVIAHAPRAKGQGRMRWNGGGRPATFRGVAQEKTVQRAHVTQKPLWLMRELVELFSDPGELVLDPYAGSGTTGVACRMLGRRFLGYEKNPEWAALAQRRINGERAVPVENQLELIR